MYELIVVLVNPEIGSVISFTLVPLVVELINYVFDTHKLSYVQLTVKKL